MFQREHVWCKHWNRTIELMIQDWWTISLKKNTPFYTKIDDNLKIFQLDPRCNRNKNLILRERWLYFRDGLLNYTRQRYSLCRSQIVFFFIFWIRLWFNRKYTNLRFHREDHNIAFSNNLPNFFNIHQSPSLFKHYLGKEKKRHFTSSLLEKTLTPKDSKTWRRFRFEWTAVEIRFGGSIPEATTPLAILSAIFPAPMNPTLKLSAEIGSVSIAKKNYWLKNDFRFWNDDKSYYCCWFQVGMLSWAHF